MTRAFNFAFRFRLLQIELNPAIEGLSAQSVFVEKVNTWLMPEVAPCR